MMENFGASKVIWGSVEVSHCSSVPILMAKESPGSVSNFDVCGSTGAASDNRSMSSVCIASDDRSPPMTIDPRPTSTVKENWGLTTGYQVFWQQIFCEAVEAEACEGKRSGGDPEPYFWDGLEER
ncbi:hypothetical protein KSP39_PZI003805 [Platanthera zijinensis]|uniref:Uncharacterized protein n=1 Tax=Platanthera zijinensis TaxID=2320716 RepID=A0AAP0BVE7_9ASPA